MNIIPLFSHPIVQCEIEDVNSEKVLNLLIGEKYKKTDYTSSNFENVSVSISENLNILSKLPELKSKIEQSLNIYIKEVLQYKTIKFKITTSWSTLTKSGGIGQRHSHTNSWISGIYYPQSIVSGGQLRFYSRKINHFSLETPQEYNIFNSDVWDFQPVKNTLLLFDSSLEHSILKNSLNENRYSLAFNVLPIGNIGSGDSKINILIK